MWHWVMYFFVALAGAGLLVVPTVGAGVTYHNYSDLSQLQGEKAAPLRST